MHGRVSVAKKNAHRRAEQCYNFSIMIGALSNIHYSLQYLIH